MKTFLQYSLASALLLTFLSAKICSEQLEESVVVEIHNNCGKKIEISVELLNNPLTTSMENGIKNKFRLKKNSEIRVNKNTIYKLKPTDNGRSIKLCN
jgi:hypothetical protein